MRSGGESHGGHGKGGGTTNLSVEDILIQGFVGGKGQGIPREGENVNKVKDGPRGGALGELDGKGGRGTKGEIDRDCWCGFQLLFPVLFPVDWRRRIHGWRGGRVLIRMARSRGKARERRYVYVCVCVTSTTSSRDGEDKGRGYREVEGKRDQDVGETCMVGH